uniref:DUF4276 family protein n=1 Tax=Candidatus Kentrum sp. FW TaxID=2126338 RepID=A0A450U2H2_9GAMM|nr:MAG: hypothetical protein BECKFW1821C_GA0114237_11184 [Candidatus Kentron sp. FW]
MNGLDTNKLAIFVEGRTEQIFAEKLVRFLGRSADIAIRVERREGGRRKPRHAIEITGTREPGGHDFFILIVDCGQDESVKSDIIDSYDTLIRKGYRCIIGMRDVLPHRREDIHHVREGFKFRLKTNPVEPFLILAVMEIEAWFLAEYSHFPRIHPNLTLERIRRELDFDPSDDDMQLRDHPAKDLEEIYFLEKIIYGKSRGDIERTVDNLDCSLIRSEVATRIDDLGRLVRLVQGFFDSPKQAAYLGAFIRSG